MVGSSKPAVTTRSNKTMYLYNILSLIWKSHEGHMTFEAAK